MGTWLPSAGGAARVLWDSGQVVANHCPAEKGVERRWENYMWSKFMLFW